MTPFLDENGAFKPGEPVIFRVRKHSNRPGSRAKEILPSAHGECYTYVVEKLWVVVEPRDDGKVVVQTRRGKRHVIDADSPQLRHPTLWERFKYRSSFPRLGEQA